MKNFYFTYGSDKQFPYQNGYSLVQANDMHEACRLFNMVHPKRKGSNCINCAFTYTEKQWNIWEPELKANYPCFETIRIAYLAPEFPPKPEPYVIVTPGLNGFVVAGYYEK